MTTEREALDSAIGELLGETPGHKLNTAGTVAVSTTQYWEPMKDCPRGVKVQLLGAGGVAAYGMWDGKNTFWEGWAPVPKRREG
jgi:hypothetical protein